MSQEVCLCTTQVCVGPCWTPQMQAVEKAFSHDVTTKVIVKYLKIIFIFIFVTLTGCSYQLLSLKHAGKLWLMCAFSVLALKHWKSEMHMKCKVTTKSCNYLETINFWTYLGLDWPWLTLATLVRHPVWSDAVRSFCPWSIFLLGQNKKQACFR